MNHLNEQTWDLTKKNKEEKDDALKLTFIKSILKINRWIFQIKYIKLWIYNQIDYFDKMD